VTTEAVFPPPSSEVPIWRRMARRLGKFLDPQDEPAEVIYGTLLAGVVLATKAGKGISGNAVLWTAVAALVFYWLAHAYADILGEQMSTRVRPGWHEVGHWAMVNAHRLRASLIPVVVFEIVRIFQGSVNVSVLTALWITVLLLAGWGMAASYRSGSRGLSLAVETLVGAALGLLVVGLKILYY
jgi:hypothetical protein